MKGIAITGSRVLDGNGTPPITNGAVLVEDGVITAVGPLAAFDLQEWQVIDAGDRTLLPALMDSHVHLAGFLAERPPAVSQEVTIAREVLDVTRGLVELARDGVCAVRDCGYPDHAIFAVREAAASGLFPSPHLVLSGRAICASGGHAASLSVEVDGVDHVRRAVRLECKAGADWIKLMITGGTATPNERVSDVQFSFDEVAAAVDEAHRRGKRVCAHCSNLAGTKMALRAGIDCVEHGIELDDEAVAMMRERDVWLSATMRCTEIEGVNRPEDRVPEFIAQRAGTIYQTQIASFQRARQAGVRLSTGSDGFMDYFPCSARSLVRELALMTDVGLTPAEAITLATRETATLLDLGDMGTLAPGKEANLLVVDGDPLAEIMDLARPWLVMRQGRLIRTPHGICQGASQGWGDA